MTTGKIPGMIMPPAAHAIMDPGAFERRYMEAVRRDPNAVNMRYARPVNFNVRQPRFRRNLTDQEVIDAMGKEESAIYNYTGMMMEAIAMQEISEWIERCKTRGKKTGRKEYRPYTRAMEQAMGGYLRTVEAYWEDRMDVYGTHFEMALKELHKELAVYVHLGMDNEICRQLPKSKDREAALQLCFTIEMLRKSIEVDREKQAIIARAMGGEVVRDNDPHIEAMIMACRRMQKDFGLTVEVTKPIRDVINTFNTRLRVYCRKMLDDERADYEAAHKESENSRLKT